MLGHGRLLKKTTQEDAPTACVQHSQEDQFSQAIVCDREFSFDRVLAPCVGQAEALELVGGFCIGRTVLGYGRARLTLCLAHGGQ